VGHWKIENEVAFTPSKEAIEQLTTLQIKQTTIHKLLCIAGVTITNLTFLF
jgi:hypothetical protein